MAGGFTGGTPARVRIKGRAASCTRFFFIAVSFMMAWVLISSELGYYSGVYGPQILLELSIAFNVPAIPVLIVSGQVEKALDRKLGPIPSIAVRLMVGLAGCTACAAAFPFLPSSHAVLLGVVAVLGMLSAIAFSTAYQLVQWFRHADIIALGIGGVATGPLVLLMQIMLDVGQQPAQWQWIAMFEITAAVMVAGLLSAASLLGQYWKVLTGEEEYVDALLPLLDEAEEDEEEEEREAVTMDLARVATAQRVLPPDPMSYGVSVALSRGAVTWPDEDEMGVPHLLRRSSTLPTSEGKWASRQARVRARGNRSQAALLSPHRIPADASSNRLRSEATSGGGRPASLFASHTWSELDLVGLMQSSATSAHFLTQGMGCIPPNTARSPSRSGAGTQPHNNNPEDTLVETPEDGQDVAGDAPAPGPVGGGGEVPRLDLAAGGLADGGLADGEQTISSPRTPQAMSLQQETREVVRQAWPVLLAFLTSVTLLYLVFPFFTYVPTSGLLPDVARVLFFGRIFADIVGRFMPRRKALLVRSPDALVILAVLKVVLALLFFAYIKAPARFHHDAVSLAIVLLLWLLGGYINTTANIMAPGLVHPKLVGRASAMMALIFQVGHFAGLVLAVVVAYILYGDMVG